MLQAYAHGLGELVYGTGKQYNCTSTKCYGAGQFDALFKRLQSEANRAGKAIGLSFTPIAVDGMIGSGTVALIAKIVKALPAVSAYPTLARLPGADMKTIAGNADIITPELTRLADSGVPVIYYNAGGGGSVNVPLPGIDILTPPPTTSSGSTSKPGVIPKPGAGSTATSSTQIPSAGTQATVTPPDVLPPMTGEKSYTPYIIGGSVLALLAVASTTLYVAKRKKKSQTVTQAAPAVIAGLFGIKLSRRRSRRRAHR